MKVEKLLLSFFAVLGGLVVAGVGFYFYQSTKAIPSSQVKTIKVSAPTPTNIPAALTLDAPQDESVTDNRTITVSGHTDLDSTLIISTDTSDQVINPSASGTFSTTVTIDTGENSIHILAINAKGEETEKIVTVTYSNEDF